MLSILIAALCVLSLTAHEAAHAFAAFYFGDVRALQEGRCTLNPLAHFGLVGGFLVPLVSFLLVHVCVGWGKPVPITRNALTANQYAMVCAAGPATNLVLCALFLPVYLLVPEVGKWLVSVNLFIGLFNLLPVPGFDGYQVMQALRGKA